MACHGCADRDPGAVLREKALMQSSADRNARAICNFPMPLPCILHTKRDEKKRATIGAVNPATVASVRRALILFGGARGVPRVTRKSGKMRAWRYISCTNRSVKSRSPHLPKPTDEQIATLAYHLHLENGCPDDDAAQDWFRAEELLTQEIARKARASSTSLQGEGFAGRPLGGRWPQAR
jgi:hypothetical protein